MSPLQQEILSWVFLAFAMAGMAAVTGLCIVLVGACFAMLREVWKD